MHKVLRVAWREYVATVRTKGFLIGLLLGPLLMSGGFLFFKLTEKRLDLDDKRIAVIDRSGLLAKWLVSAALTRDREEVYAKEGGQKTRPSYLVEIIQPNDTNTARQRLELSDRVRAKRLHAFVEIGADVLHPQTNAATSRVAYYSHASAIDEARQWMARVINDRLRELRLAELGVEKSAVKDLFAYVQVEGMNLVSADPKTGEIKKTERQSEIRAVVVPLVLTMLTYLLLLIGSTPLLQSVMEEKSQRIAEVLLGCVKPFQFMLGKVLGGVGVSITASAVYFGVALVLLLSMGVANLVPFNVLPWFMVYLLVAVVMMGAVFATLGSLCSEPKHAQALTLPAMLPVMLPMFALGPLMKAPHSAFGTVLSFLPPCTPMVMVFRQCTSAGVPAWQPWAALLGMVLTTILAVWIGGRVFRVGLLLHGGLPKLADMARWAIKG